MQDCREQAEAIRLHNQATQELGVYGVVVSILRLTAAEVESKSAKNRAARGVVVMPSSMLKHPPSIPVGKSKPRYEKILVEQCLASGITGFCGEYLFDDDRNWRIDLAWPQQKLAVEIDGSVHRIKARFQADIEKHQALFFAGWRLLRVSTHQVRDRVALRLIEMALGRSP